MKRCPKCSREYDVSMSFCLDDGAELLYGPASATDSEPKTAILSGDRVSGEQATRKFDGDPIAPRAAVGPAARTASTRNSVIAGVVGIVLVTALGLGGYLYFGRGSGKQIDSIAVMPFVNESGNADLEYLSDGMTETLINALMQLPNLSVQARSSVFRYKGKETDARAIGRELNVQAILNGRVVQRSDGLTLYLELVDAIKGNRIWGEQYDRKQSDLVSLQREVARDVASKLQAKLSSADQQKLAKSYTSSAEAYQFYLKGNSYWERRTRKNVEIAIGFYQQAIDKDPNYALAYAGLAEAYAQPTQQPQGLSKARAAALKALSLDNDLPEAHSVLARLLANYDYDFSGAERELRRALELNPNYADARCRYGLLLSHLGRFEAAEAEFRRALELEPLSLACNNVYGVMMFHARRYDDAIKQLKKTLELDENFWLTHASLASVYQITGNYAESVKELARVAEINGHEQNAARIRESFEEHGWVGVMRFMVGEERQGGRQGYGRARAYSALGEKDNAFAALNAAYENRDSSFPWIKVDPLLDPLRDDPRFSELLKRVGFPE